MRLFRGRMHVTNNDSGYWSQETQDAQIAYCLYVQLRSSPLSQMLTTPPNRTVHLHTVHHVLATTRQAQVVRPTGVQPGSPVERGGGVEVSVV